MAVSKQTILIRFYLVSVFTLILVFCIIYKMVNVQWFQGDKYREEAIENAIKTFEIPANRGNVYTSDGSLLATSVPKYDVRMDISIITKKIFNRDILELSKAMSRMFGKPVSYYENYFKQARNQKNKFLLIANNLSYNNYEQVKNFPILKLGTYKGGLIVNQRTVRGYPLGKIAARTIGYDDKRGESGIEGSYSEFLKGHQGQHLKQKIAKGQWKPISDENEIDPVDGLDVITSIDLNIQDIAHHALLEQLENYEADHGTVVVMEVKTGQVKAISNLARTEDGTYYEKRNFAVWETHEPGSTFKVMGMVAALDDKLIDTTDIIDTERGIITIHGKKIIDSHRGGFGKITAAQVIEYSSNVGMAKIITQNYGKNPQKFIDKLHAMNVGKKLNISIGGESMPKVPEPKNKNWNGLSLPWMAWGYGVEFTDLQTLTFYNAIANNGKMVRPLFVKEIKDQDKIISTIKPEVIVEKICSQETLIKIQTILKNVVKSGTARNIYLPYFALAGKTGTCQIDYWKESGTQYISSFVGYFPAESPKYSCIVVIHKPNKKFGYYGADVAGPAFKKIAQKIYVSTPLYESLTRFDTFDKSQILKTKAVSVAQVGKEDLMPDLNKMAGMDAIALLENLGFRVTCEGYGKVASQSIKPGDSIKNNKNIYLKLL